MRLLVPLLTAVGLSILVGTNALSQSNESSVLKLGQSAAFSGPAGELGKELRLGIEAALFEANQQGGINGKRVVLSHHDDGYEPVRAIRNTRALIEDERVFALIGAVGTPTSRAVVPIAEEAGVPYVAPFTGAQFLRNTDRFSSVVNFRASYRQEIDEMVDRLMEDRGIDRIGILYQNDSFGRSGHENLISSLKRFDLEPTGIGTYERNTTAVKTAVLDLMRANPQAVIIVGAYQPAAAAILWSYQLGFEPLFINISFVGSRALAKQLGKSGYEVFVTQVVPDFRNTELRVAQSYLSALEAVSPGAEPGYNSFEGYIAAKMLLSAISDCSEPLTRDCVFEQFRKTESMDIHGLSLTFGPGDNQGSEEVYLTALNSDGRFTPVETLNEDPRE